MAVALAPMLRLAPSVSGGMTAPRVRERGRRQPRHYFLIVAIPVLLRVADSLRQRTLGRWSCPRPAQLPRDARRMLLRTRTCMVSFQASSGPSAIIVLAPLNEVGYDMLLTPDGKHPPPESVNLP